MKCKYCDGTGTTNWCVNGTFLNCPHCGGTGEVELTNEEHLKSCTTEQLADWLEENFDLCGAGCSNCFIKELCFDEHNNKMPRDLFVEWLKQPHSAKE